MKITNVTVRRVKEDTSRQPSWLGSTVIANPMSIYPEYKAQRSSWNAGWGSDLLVTVQTDSGIEGVGCMVPAGARIIIEEHFRALLTGQDPFNIEKLWDQMFRSSLPYGRKGLPIMAISAVDIALWDIVGKAIDQPVYRLLGGAVRDGLPTYSTGNDIDLQGARVRRVQTGDAVRTGRWLGRHEEERRPGRGGTGDRRTGRRHHARLLHGLERRLHPPHVAPLEPFGSAGSRNPSRRTTMTATPSSPKSNIPIATGEHEYTRWGYQQLISRRCCHILQPDRAWVGGISEAKKIAGMASAWGLDVIPHAGGLHPWSLHFMISTVNCPQAEWVVIGNPGENDASRNRYPYLSGVPEPVNGIIRPSDEPGIGVTVNEEWLEPANG